MIKNLLYSIILVAITVLVIVNLQAEFAGSPWLQIIVISLIVLSAAPLFIYLLFHKTRADKYAISFVQMLFVIYLVIFLVTIWNIVFKVLNVIPFLLQQDPWIGNLFPGPYMWLGALAIIPSLFSLFLSICWEETTKEEGAAAY